MIAESPMKVTLDISPYWPQDRLGEPASVNSVCNEIRDTDMALGHRSLSTARSGMAAKLDLSTLLKLSRLCSSWAGKKIWIEDLLVIEEDT